MTRIATKVGSMNIKTKREWLSRQKKEYERGEKFIGYQEECKYPNSPYIYTYLYNKKGELIFSCTSFYGFPIGKGIKYDSRGLATNSIDYDELYKFWYRKSDRENEKRIQCGLAG